MTESNPNLPLKLSPGRCKPSKDARVPREIHHTDSASAIIVYVGRWIPDASCSAIFQMTGSSQKGNPKCCVYEKWLIFVSDQGNTC